MVAASGMAWAAEGFAPPAEGPVAFRRDKLPLDQDAISGLSRNVEALASGLNAETAADRRGAAQMLALALALDPANARARQLKAAYQAGTHQPDTDASRLEKSRARIWQVTAWLETPDAGADGQALAACLKDVMVVSDPKHPKAASLRQTGEKGAWAGWVPSLSAYEVRPAVASTDSSDEADAVEKTEVPPTLPEKPLLAKATAYSLVWQWVGREDNGSWVLAPASLEMTAEYHQPTDSDTGPTQFSLTVGSGNQASPLAQTARLISRLLEATHGSLPANLQVRVGGKELDRALEAKRKISISAAAAVLASAAVTGVEPDAIVIGSVDENGAFKLPSSFWDQLHALGKGTGRRLVLPAEAVAVLPSILALERPEFFMQYEVLLARDFKELLAMSAKSPQSHLSAPLTRLKEIRDRMGTQDLRQYIGNTFVKQRLMTVSQECPHHFSAKALVVQASGNRPTLVARSVLASELLRALEPMKWIVSVQDRELSQAELTRVGAVHDQCRTGVDAMQRYTEKADQALLDKALELVTAVRNLDRATRARGENYVVMEGVRSARRELGRLYQVFREATLEATGEAPVVSGP